jgi:hypothetical protein
MMSGEFNQNMEAWKSNEHKAMSECECDFPPLEKQRKCSKKNVIKIVVPLRTYKDELREKYSESFAQRSVSENFKTRMCNSVDAEQPCFHGDECKFAHSLKELVTRDCNFKDRCRFVKIKSGKLVNEGSNVCRNKHPGEDQDNFIKRTGLLRYKTRAPKHEEINVYLDEDIEANHESIHEEINVDLEETEANHEEINVDLDESNQEKIDVDDKTKVEESVACPTNYWATKTSGPVDFVSSPPFGGLTAPPFKPASAFKFGGFTAFPPTQTHGSAFMKFTGTKALEKEILLRVPKVLAMQALELAMNSGNRCIRVEVIE